MKTYNLRDFIISCFIFSILAKVLHIFNKESLVQFNPIEIMNPIDWILRYIAPIIIIIELIYSLSLKDGHHNKIDSKNNFIIGTGRGLIESFFLVIIDIKLYSLGNQITNLSLSTNSILNWLLGLLLIDLCYYWDHRFSHYNKFLWANHSIHHSSNYYNFLTSSRGSWFECIYRWIFRFPLALIGMHPFMIIALFKGLRLYQFFQHTDRIKGHFKLLELIFVSPESHRIHHSKQKQYKNKNFGGIFNLWDVLFKTYIKRKENEEIIYGITQNTSKNNPLSILFNPLISLFYKSRN